MLENNIDLEILKQEYSEDFSALCQELFPNLLERQGILTKTILKRFAPNKILFKCVKNKKELFKEYINNLAEIENDLNDEEQLIYPFYSAKINVQNNLGMPITHLKQVAGFQILIHTQQDLPKNLFENAGYNFYECENFSDLEKFKKYTPIMHDGFNEEKFKNYKVWFAVKKNVDDINILDPSNNSKNDEYAKSVIQIIYSCETNNSLEIYNRYGNTYNGTPFDSLKMSYKAQLDNIIPGLAKAFANAYNLDLAQKTFLSRINFHMLGQGMDGQHHKYNVEVGGFFNIPLQYYCADNCIIVDGVVYQFDEDRYLLIDNHLIDLEEKTVKSFCGDSFAKTISKIDHINIIRDKKGQKLITITPVEGEDIKIATNPQNQMVGYDNPNVTTIEKNFLEYANALQYLNLQNVVSIQKGFLNLLHDNQKTLKMNLPKLQYIDNSSYERLKEAFKNSPTSHKLNKTFSDKKVIKF